MPNITTANTNPPIQYGPAIILVGAFVGLLVGAVGASVGLTDVNFVGDGVVGFGVGKPVGIFVGPR